MNTDYQHKIKPRIESERTALGAVIPLRTPFVVFVDPSSACNFQCRFCPTGDRALIRSTGRFTGTLGLDDYAKVLTDIAAFEDKLKVLRLYKDGEPLLNKNLPAMIAMAREAGVAQSIDTTTNGFLLNGKTGEALVKAGLDRINISVNGLDSEQIHSFAGVTMDFPKFVANLRDFYSVSGDCQVMIKTTTEIIGDERRAEFFDLFGGCCDRIFVEYTSPCWPDFDVEDRMDIQITRGIYDTEIQDVSICPYLFYSISVNADLSVSACFVDWSHSLKIGNLRTESLRDVWNGRRLQAHRLSHLRGRQKQHSICGKCSQLTHCMADNIEADAPMLLDRYEALPAESFDAGILAEYEPKS